MVEGEIVVVIVVMVISGDCSSGSGSVVIFEVVFVSGGVSSDVALLLWD